MPQKSGGNTGPGPPFAEGVIHRSGRGGGGGARRLRSVGERVVQRAGPSVHHKETFPLCVSWGGGRGFNTGQSRPRNDSVPPPPRPIDTLLSSGRQGLRSKGLCSKNRQKQFGLA